LTIAGRQVITESRRERMVSSTAERGDAAIVGWWEELGGVRRRVHARGLDQMQTWTIAARPTSATSRSAANVDLNRTEA
jgi:hypothetical protein